MFSPAFITRSNKCRPSVPETCLVVLVSSARNKVKAKGQWKCLAVNLFTMYMASQSTLSPRSICLPSHLPTDLSLKTHTIIELLTRWLSLRALNSWKKKVLTIIATLNLCFTTRPYTSNTARQIKARRTSVVVKKIYISHLLLVGTFVGLVGS